MPLFALTVFLSAFLLFQIQPMAAKMILPLFGGASSVWSTCLVFFQAELLLGYLYVHWLHETLAPRRQALLHVALLLASLLALPVAADPSWKDTAQAQPVASVLGVLAAAVGLPYLLLSTTGPLMQAWYARAFTGAMPYRLYALSNLASMLALLSYPLLVEPFLEVRSQAWSWSAGYALFVAACLATAAWSWRQVPATRGTPAAPAPYAAPHPGWRDCLLWGALAMTASILLLAMTRHLTQDVAPVPFLWALPLALYLLSFILCFDAPRYYVRPLFLGALPFAFLGMDRILDEGMPVPWMIALISTALFVFCMVCHGELVRRKPDPRHLTLFYLMLSLGGALGGMFVGLLAPMLFHAYFELPIGLFLCALLATVALWRGLRPRWRVLLLLALCGYGWRLGMVSKEFVDGYIVTARNFYSQLRVSERHDGGPGWKRVMVHGRINHGEQYLAEAHRRTPTTYYCHDSGVGRALFELPKDRPLKLGMVGLGTGTLAAYGRAGDELRIYEINEQVLELANSHFTYLADSPARIVPVLGDGRLMLEAEPDQGFDLLAVDAFSGDSIPAHLLTLEAMQGYLRHLRPDGILAIHITNRYLNLRPVVAAAAQHHGSTALLYALESDPENDFCFASDWVLVMRPERAAALPLVMNDGEPLVVQPGFRPWTDGFSNLFSVLK